MSYSTFDGLELPEITAELRPHSKLLAAGNYGPAAEKYRLMAHKLHSGRREKTLQTVLVTSSIPAEGKTSVAANLATVLAQTSPGVLLVDADLRAADLPKALGLEGNLPGLSDVLVGELSLSEAVRRVNPLGLYLLSAGSLASEPVTLLESAAFDRTLEAARRHFDWIIVDSPPLAPFADAHSLAARADGIVLVVRWGFTPTGELDRSIEALAGLPLTGLVLNAFDEPHHDDYYTYYKQNRTPRRALARGASGR